MNISSKITRSELLCLAVLACLLAGATSVAVAVPPGQALRSGDFLTLTGQCCFSWNKTVKVTEPPKVVPVVVTFSLDHIFGGDVTLVGLSVNSGPCQFYGAKSIYPLFHNDDTAQTRTFNWVVLPSDGPPGNALHKGSNSFTLCGGAQRFASSSITLENSTLVVRISD